MIPETRRKVFAVCLVIAAMIGIWGGTYFRGEPTLGVESTGTYHTYEFNDTLSDNYEVTPPEIRRNNA